jgi:hypothetical protein
VKTAPQWISEHGQSGDYPKVDEPVGCFTEAQVRLIQWDAHDMTPQEIRELAADLSMDLMLSKSNEEGN